MAMKVFSTNFLLNDNPSQRILMKLINFKTFSSRYILLFLDYLGLYFPSTVLHFGEKIQTIHGKEIRVYFYKKKILKWTKFSNTVLPLTLSLCPSFLLLQLAYKTEPSCFLLLLFAEKHPEPCCTTVPSSIPTNSSTWPRWAFNPRWTP